MREFSRSDNLLGVSRRCFAFLSSCKVQERGEVVIIVVRAFMPLVELSLNLALRSIGFLETRLLL